MLNFANTHTHTNAQHTWTSKPVYIVRIARRIIFEFRTRLQHYRKHTGEARETLVLLYSIPLALNFLLLYCPPPPLSLSFSLYWTISLTGASRNPPNCREDIYLVSYLFYSTFLSFRRYLKKFCKQFRSNEQLLQIKFRHPVLFSICVKNVY